MAMAAWVHDAASGKGPFKPVVRPWVVREATDSGSSTIPGGLLVYL